MTPERRSELRPLAQQAFNAVWQHFVIAGAPRSVENPGTRHERCLYRRDDGARCAFGLLIEDRDYAPCAEGQPATNFRPEDFPHSPLAAAALEFKSLPEICGGTATLAGAMQTAHDNYFPTLHARLRLVADDFGLRVPEEAPWTP